MSTASAVNTTEMRLNRTCEGCQKRKIKCIPNAKEAGRSPDKCVRCTRLNVECTFRSPAIRKTRRRQETHIRELEQRLEQVWQLVSTKQDLGPWLSSTSRTPESTNETNSTPLSSAGNLRAYSVPGVPEGSQPVTDPIAQGLVEESVANELCLTFCTKSIPHYPLVFVPTPVSWQALRQDRPALFRAILAGASGCFRPSLSMMLYRNAEQYVSEQAVLSGRKSLDLIQAALILATWSRPADRFQDLNFGQFANIAANMVTELRSSNDDRYQVALKNGTLASDDQQETARTFAACYLLCSSIAMSYRRPNSLCYGSWVQDCVDVLESNPNAPVEDLRLAAWTRLQRVAEESLTMAGLDEVPSANASDLRNWAVLEGGREQVREWGKALPAGIMNGTVGIHYQTILLNLTVPGLHDIHATQDFRPPFAIRPGTPSDASSGTSLRYIDASIGSLNAARSIADLFLEFSVEELRQLPVVVFTRIIYAVVVIIKLDFLRTSTSRIIDMGTGEAASVLETLHCIVDRLGQASLNSRFDIPATFHAVLSRLVGWCDGIALSLSAGPDEIIEPLMNLSAECPKQSPLPSDQAAFNGSLVDEYDVFEVGSLPQSMEIDLFADPAVIYGDDLNILSDVITDTVPWDDSLANGYFPVNLE